MRVMWQPCRCVGLGCCAPSPPFPEFHLRPLPPPSLCSNPWGIEAHTGPMMLSEGAAPALVAALVGQGGGWGSWWGREGEAPPLRRWWGRGGEVPCPFCTVELLILLLLPLLQTRYMNATVPAPGATAPRDYSLLVLACQVRRLSSPAAEKGTVSWLPSGAEVHPTATQALSRPLPALAAAAAAHGPVGAPPCQVCALCLGLPGVCAAHPCPDREPCLGPVHPLYPCPCRPSSSASATSLQTRRSTARARSASAAAPASATPRRPRRQRASRWPSALCWARWRPWHRRARPERRAGRLRPALSTCSVESRGLRVSLSAVQHASGCDAHNWVCGTTLQTTGKPGCPKRQSPSFDSSSLSCLQRT